MWTDAAFTTAAVRSPAGRAAPGSLDAARAGARGQPRRAAGGRVPGVPREQLLEPGHLAAPGQPAQPAVALAHVDLAEAASGLRSVVRRRPELRHPDHGCVEDASLG